MTIYSIQRDGGREKSSKMMQVRALGEQAYRFVGLRLDHLLFESVQNS